MLVAQTRVVIVEGGKLIGFWIFHRYQFNRFLKIFLKILFILREREGESEHERGEGQTEREKRTPHRAGSLMWGSSQDPEIMTRADSRRLTD